MPVANNINLTLPLTATLKLSTACTQILLTSQVLMIRVDSDNNQKNDPLNLVQRILFNTPSNKYLNYLSQSLVGFFSNKTSKENNLKWIFASNSFIEN